MGDLAFAWADHPVILGREHEQVVLIKKWPALAERCTERSGKAGLQVLLGWEGQDFNGIEARFTDAVECRAGKADLVPDRSGNGRLSACKQVVAELLQ